MANREFRRKRDTRPPVEFKIYFDVPVLEKVEDPEQESGYIERETGELVEQVATFHYTLKVPSDLALRIQAGNDLSNLQANGDQAAAIRELLATAVVEQDEFQALMRDGTIDSEILQGLVQQIMDDAAQRPTK